MIANTSIRSTCLNDNQRTVHHSAANPLILVIEDDSDNLVLLYHFLRLNHFEVVMASDALTGFELAAIHLPDLILLEIKLPKISGYDLIRRLQKNLKLAHIPIIAVTSLSAEKDKRKILQSGCADYICKPYLLDYLQEVIQRQLDKLIPLTLSA